MSIGIRVEREQDDHERFHWALPIAATTRDLQRRGLTIVESANLTARLAGLGFVRSGWTVRQIEHLVFLRSIVDSGRLAP
jgi:hypothetical protein